MQLLGRRLLKLLHGLLQASHGAFERDDLGVGRAQLLPGLERILGHKPLQKVDVALKAPRSLVQLGGFRLQSIELMPQYQYFGLQPPVAT